MTKRQLYAKYMLELNRLKRLAKTNNFTPDGDAKYYEQYQRVKAAYELIVRAETA